MRRLDLTFTALLVPLDFFALFCAALYAYAFRYSPALIEMRPILTQIPFASYFASATGFVLIWMVLFWIAGLYSIRPRNPWNELGRIILACTAGVMIIIASVFFGRELTTSRFIILAVWGLAILFVSSERLLLRLLRHALLVAGYGHQRVVLIGQSKTADELRTLYANHPKYGYRMIRSLRVWNESTQKLLADLHRKNAIDGILLADAGIDKNHALDLMAFAANHTLTFRYVADLYAAALTHVEFSTTDGIPIIEIKQTPLDGWGRIAKRVFDLVGSSLFLLVVSPVMLLVSLAIKLDSRGPILFRRLDDGTLVMRVGEGGKPFPYFKFRSMYPNVHSQRYTELARQDMRKGPLVKIKNDPRVTRVGRFIRKWSLDEFPEFLLVFLGRMSLVGPRPHYPEEVANYSPQQRRVLAIKPGITGLAQISGRSNLSFEDEVRLDLWYIEHWSLALDLYILLKTPFAVIAHRRMEEGV